ncbi:MAG TPA: ribokinase [Mollicutes bacterium]|nr:ribokinase [Mollicutes bacterium]
MAPILVVGSINADQVVVTDIVPRLGETVIGKSFKIVPGGKGANQAVAASRLGADVSFIGCVGNDTNGTFLLNNFKNNNVITDGIKIIDNASSGIAAITVCEGKNSIIVAPGANYHVTKEIIDEKIDLILKANLVLLQLEIPLDTVEYIVDICYENKIPVILNPAPAFKLKESIIDKVTYLTPNEHETETIFNTNDFDSLVTKYPNKLIITLGEKGLMYFDGEKVINIPANKVEVVDTTGAGDTFNGALAYKLVNNASLKDSLIFANKAASLKIKQVGAQNGMPTLSEMEE